MQIWLAVAGGGAIGSLARWQLSAWLRSQAPAWPWGTLLVNVLGCLLIGCLAGYLAARPLPEWLRLGLMTGLLGGFTTFSAFSLETLELLRHGAGAALLNVAANLVLALAACALGYWLARAL
jgi:fluoride exporter